MYDTYLANWELILHADYTTIYSIIFILFKSQFVDYEQNISYHGV
jgi:hypothetical protein